MKKTLGIILSTALAFSVLALPIFAVDTTSGASEAPAATTTPAASAPAATAPATKTTTTQAATVDTSNLAPGSYYTVVSGDVFWKIAAKYGMTVDQLAKLNPQIKNINLIYPGQKIIVKADDTTFDNCKTVEDIEKILAGYGKDVKIGVQTGTTGQFYVEGDRDWGFDGYNVTCVGYKSGSLAVQDMLNGNINLVIIDEAPAQCITDAFNALN